MQLSNYEFSELRKAHESTEVASEYETKPGTKSIHTRTFSKEIIEQSEKEKMSNGF